MDQDSIPKTYQDLQRLVKEQAGTIERLSEALTSSRYHFKKVLTSFPLGLLVADENAKIIAINKQLEELIQAKAEAVAGKAVTSVLPEGDNLKPDPKPGRSIAKKMTGEEFPVEIFVNQFKEGSKQNIFIHIQDITERQRLEQLKQDLVAMVSHDLRTPLTSIQAVLTMLDEGVYGELNQKALNAVGRAQSSADYLVGLVDDLLDSEKLESGKFDIEFNETSVGKIIEKTLHSIGTAAAKSNVELITDYTNDTFHGEEDRLVQVLLNLVSNAIKYSPSNSLVEIKAGIDGTDVKFSVSDKGPGIPQTMQPTIFERFKQAEQEETTRKKGFGLGLAIARALVIGHNGKIWVESAPGKGSTFFFTIPLIDNW